MPQANTVLGGGNATPQAGGWLNYVPTLTGTTDNPVLTTSVQLGRFMLYNNICALHYVLTITGYTKTTTTDVVQCTIPVTAATLTNSVQRILTRLEDTTGAVANYPIGEIASGALVHTYRNYQYTTASVQALYKTNTNGIGTTGDTITFQGHGYYEF